MSKNQKPITDLSKLADAVKAAKPSDKLLKKQLIDAIKKGNAARYVEIVTDPAGYALLATLTDAQRAAAKKLGASVASQHDTSVQSASRPTAGLDGLAKTYLANAIRSLVRVPSPSLKPDFRATLKHWGALVKMGLIQHAEPTAFVNAVLAIVQTEGAWEAVRMVRNVSQQLLWQVSVDVSRDRRLNDELAHENHLAELLGKGVDESEGDTVATEPRGGRSTIDGEEDHEDADAIRPPTEDEAMDAYVEAHAWLSSIADLLSNDEDDRLRLGLEDGLEYTQLKIPGKPLSEDERAIAEQSGIKADATATGEATWKRIYSPATALTIQLQKNKESMRKRDANKVLARKDAFKALAALAA